MAKTTTAEIINLGFVPEMFSKDDDAGLTTLAAAVLAEQSAMLSGRIGSVLYNVATSPVQDYVKRAELCLCGAELVQRRINRLLGNAVGSGQELDISPAKTQRESYLSEAEALIARIASGSAIDSGSDISFSTLITSTFSPRESS